jgi:hypothetical protein
VIFLRYIFKLQNIHNYLCIAMLCPVSLEKMAWLYPNADIPGHTRNVNANG